MHLNPGVLSHGDPAAGQRLDTALEWSDLDAPPGLQRELAALRDHAVLQRRRAGPALFLGPQGQGQALVAALLGKSVGVPAFRIDLGAVSSRYIGETEKNLARIIDEAERSGAVLFFDEADALFGKRTEVTDSHDRYANVAVSYLLQRMESYNGLAILATNARSSIDPAFLRRLRHIVAFQTPVHPPKDPQGR